jgi:glycosyltransferase involved in cell wall biosynthesis
MSEELLFSVVIPTYNRASFIQNTIQSVLSQSYRNFEIIVIDDGSTDNTKEVIDSKNSKKLKYFRIENSERGAARNFGSRYAAGDYINFLDSDDLLYSSHLALANKYLLELNHTEVFYLNYDFRDDEGKLLRETSTITGDLNKQLIYGNILSCNGVFLRKDIALKFPYVEDRKLSGSEDWELWLRLASRYQLYYANQITSTMVNHESRSVLTSNEEKLLKRKELALSYAFSDEKVKESFGRNKNKMEAFCYSYISLHLALAKEKRESIRYLVRGAKLSVQILLRRRFLAILKHLLT